jgi:hypothetical protein
MPPSFTGAERRRISADERLASRGFNYSNIERIKRVKEPIENNISNRLKYMGKVPNSGQA